MTIIVRNKFSKETSNIIGITRLTSSEAVVDTANRVIITGIILVIGYFDTLLPKIIINAFLFPVLVIIFSDVFAIRFNLHIIPLLFFFSNTLLTKFADWILLVHSEIWHIYTCSLSFTPIQSFQSVRFTRVNV